NRDDRIEPVHLGHLEIHERDVRTMGTELLDSFLPVRTLGNHFHVCLARHQRRDAAAQDGMIVNSEDPNDVGRRDHELAPVFLTKNQVHKRPLSRGVAYAAAAGTFRSTSVPSPFSLQTSRWPPISSARSRMPGRPKCPSIGAPSIAGSIP